MCDLERARELRALSRLGQGQVLGDDARCGKGKAAEDLMMIDHFVTIGRLVLNVGYSAA
jgi:hypothetical protein